MRPKLFSAVGFDGKRGGVIGQSKRQMQCESKYGLITGGLLFLLGPARLAGPAFTGDQWGRVLHASLFWADFPAEQVPPDTANAAFLAGGPVHLQRHRLFFFWRDGGLVLGVASTCENRQCCKRHPTASPVVSIS